MTPQYRNLTFLIIIVFVIMLIMNWYLATEQNERGSLFCEKIGYDANRLGIGTIWCVKYSYDENGVKYINEIREYQSWQVKEYFKEKNRQSFNILNLSSN